MPAEFVCTTLLLPADGFPRLFGLLGGGAWVKDCDTDRVAGRDRAPGEG